MHINVNDLLKDIIIFKGTKNRFQISFTVFDEYTFEIRQPFSISELIFDLIYDKFHN